MYIENPNKKISYSFRIKPEVLEDLKLYAKATNSTVPKIINQLITDKLDGVTLTNDYLTHFKNQLITIPDFQTIYENTNTIKMAEIMDLLNPFLKGTVFKVDKIPNNLDVWDNTDNLVNNHGYTSQNYPHTIHEGIEFVLAPELLRDSHLDRGKIEIQVFLENTVLLPIWFKVTHNNTLEIELITFREAMAKVKQTNNFTLMDKLSNFKVLTDSVINEVVNETPKDQLYNKLLQELSKLTRVINTGNIMVTITPEGTLHKSDDGYTNGSPMSELMNENQALKERVNELEEKFNNLTELFKEIENIEAREEAWESLKKEN